VALNNPAERGVELIRDLRGQSNAWWATVMARELIQAQKSLCAVIEKVIPRRTRSKIK
jgi:hypothetical protein